MMFWKKKAPVAVDAIDWAKALPPYAPIDQAEWLRTKRKDVLLDCATGGLPLEEALKYAEYVVPQEKIDIAQERYEAALVRYDEKMKEWEARNASG